VNPAIPKWIGKSATAIAALLVCAPPAQAKITRIVIDNTIQGPVYVRNGTNLPTAPTTLGNYNVIVGRAFGELDPTDRRNSIITDINFGKDADGKVRYVATFQLVVPKDLSKASGFMWHDVPNRGGRITIVTAEQALGDIGLSSAWQSDNAGATAVPPLSIATSTSPQPTLGGGPPVAYTPAPGGGAPGQLVSPGGAGSASANNEWVIVPVARNADGSSITGFLQGRIVNRSGAASQPLNVMGNPIPYLPATLDTTHASLTTRYYESVTGKFVQGPTIPSTDWAFSHCTTWASQVPQDLNHADLPGTLPVHVCLKNGFDPNVLYELVYPVKDPWVTGIGHAAFRDLNSFFKNERADSFGTPNPIAGVVKWSAIRGVSQSGNFTRAFLHLGFNEDEAGRKVHDGAWPIIAGRRVSLDTRWAQPDGVLELYQMGSEGPQWWGDWPDRVRHLPTRGILDRCTASNTCPKVIEHFGGSEVFALKMTTEWVGTSADADIPLPDNVRRYYVSSSTHGGGSGAMTQNSSATGAGCPGNNWNAGAPGAYRANPMPEAQLVNVLRLAMRNWLMNGTPPPPSVWPRISNGTLVESTPEAMHFPHGIPAIPETVFAPESFVFPVFDYDWGPFFNETDATGVATDVPPRIEHVIQMKVPRVDGDGNEVGGVPTVLRDAPLGTYLGWNLTTTGVHQTQVCNYVGGFIPFAVTPAQRQGPDMNVKFQVGAKGKWSHAAGVAKDPRASLQERYGTHAGYVAAVTAAANNAVAQGYLLAADATALIAQANVSDVLQGGVDSSLRAYGEVNIGVGDGDHDGDDHGAGTSELKVNAGDAIPVAYSFSLPGRHAAATVTLSQAQVIVHASCDGPKHHHTVALPIVINLPDASYSVAANSSATVTSATAASAPVPDVCNGRPMKIGDDATFTAMVGSQ
jgi:Alpha/beta hydrolase domain